MGFFQENAMMVGSKPSNNIDSSKNLHEEARTNPSK
jgi:hypothetical protein